MAADKESSGKGRSSSEGQTAHAPSPGDFPNTDSVPPLPVASPSSPWLSYKEHVARLAGRRSTIL